jgi:hypothetical protein
MPKRGPFELCSENDVNKFIFRWAPCFKTNVTAAQPLTDETWAIYGCFLTLLKWEQCYWDRMAQFICCIGWLLAIDCSMEVGTLSQSSLLSMCGDWPWTVVAVFTSQWFGITTGFLVLLLLLLTKDLPPGLWNVRSSSCRGRTTLEGMHRFRVSLDVAPNQFRSLRMYGTGLQVEKIWRKEKLN